MPTPKREFKNPLTLASTETSPQSSTLPSTFTSTSPSTFTSTSTSAPRRKRGAQAFEKTHERFTCWMDKNLKAQFEALADSEGAAKSTLLDEAITDLLKKHQA